MSGHSVLAQASEALRKQLFDELKLVKLADGNPPPQDLEHCISLCAPSQEGDAQSSHRLSLWLYFVTENEHVKNRAPSFGADGLIKPPPLALTLYFLATPLSADDNDEKMIASNSAYVLGAVLEAFHKSPIIPLVIPEAADGSETAASEELHVSLCRLSLEELTRIWEALNSPYQLSVCFKVNVVRIDSKRTTIGTPIVARRFISGRIKQSAG
ncbi:hypothetical protein X770_00940 [Mesorhizobium sp. LSJC269B00]|uniref:DUF4255 domain-containing protein n=1 Tax=Mesorhizobium sp. LSJC269B00 TaxID=1287326 RepID=UPI0003CE5EE2|nr:DUF4255 domain-containing protein [Mesorhizobium sp. LSJC269B00]ESW93818.1 hypothetical protein X770_00940 [Mesorhizobium sp. LSJC269B00]